MAWSRGLRQFVILSDKDYTSVVDRIVPTGCSMRRSGTKGGKMIMRVLKFILVVLLILVGVLFVYDGMGFEYRIFNHDLVATYGIPVGIALVIIGALMGKFWDIARDLN
jgi:hypothetical protein